MAYIRSEFGDIDFEFGQPRTRVTKIGDFRDDGQPVGWEFDIRGAEYAGIEMYDNCKTILWAGYTIDELHEIKQRMEK